MPETVDIQVAFIDGLIRKEVFTLDTVSGIGEVAVSFCRWSPRIETIVISVEIKGDNDKRDQTRAKGQYGEDHFITLNCRLIETTPIDLPEHFRYSLNQQYIFSILRPSDYQSWFNRLRTGPFIFDQVHVS